METNEMGRVLTEAKIENLRESLDAERGFVSDDQVRRVSSAMPSSTLGQLCCRCRRTPFNNLVWKKLASRASQAVPVAARPTCIPPSASPFRPLLHDGLMEVPDNVPVLIGRNPAPAPGLRRRSAQPHVDWQSAHGERACVRAVLATLDFYAVQAGGDSDHCGAAAVASEPRLSEKRELCRMSPSSSAFLQPPCCFPPSAMGAGRAIWRPWPCSTWRRNGWAGRE